MSKQDQQPEITDKETERFYNISYFIIPIPMIAGLIFAAWVLLTEDSRDQSYCVIAASASAYQKDILQAPDFTYRKSITLDVCKEKDEAIDGGDGRKSGKVRWFICEGTTCGPDWEHALAEK